MAIILFFDDWPLCYMENVKRTFCKPKFIPEATLPDINTEGTWNFPFVWFDKEENKWKALYGAALHLDGPPRSDGILFRTQALMYAESSDGIHWIKPDLTGMRSCCHDSPYKNQVFGVSDMQLDGGPVFLDENEPNPERRFKFLYHMELKQGFAVSPDGIKWSFADDINLGEYMVDSPIIPFYNHKRKSYCVSRRLHNGDRRIALWETTDWKNYKNIEVVVHPDSEDPQLVQFYGMPVYRYENIYIGLLWRYFTHPMSEIRHKYIGGGIDCALTYSLDGWHFNRATHEAFIPQNERGEHGSGCIYCGAMVTTDTEIRFYSGGSKGEHFQNQTLEDAALMLHTMRKDGFFKIESHVMRGRFMTRMVMFSGGNLSLNVKAPTGKVRLQITDPNGIPVEGFRFDDCESFTGDEIYWKPNWKSGKTIKALIDNKQYHFDIELINAEVYAIRGDFEFKYGNHMDKAPLKYEL